ncbi:MAG: hypothetical protein M9921_08755 [Fimbriimonadaceae bacterium]|nr:hypothetical protein [Fimbriimonadaceae bacterium]
MLTRRALLRHSALAAAGACLPHWVSGRARDDALIRKDDLAFLEALARATVAAATIAPGTETGNTVGFPLVTPGGHYPALWVRDFSMACGCGLLSAQTMRDHLRLIAKTQNGPDERRLASGAIIPPFAIADHINFDGQPVFYPGTYDAGEHQGGEPWGVLPPVDDHYEFIHIAAQLWRTTRDATFLAERIEGRTLWERLQLALDVPTVDDASGMIKTDVARRAVGFGFCDTVFLTGAMLFASLLRYRALGEMLELRHAAGHPDPIGKYAFFQEWMAMHLAETFGSDGWLSAATGVGRQPDVWGTLFSLDLGVLKGKRKETALDVVVGAFDAGSITFEGAVRHVPRDHDFSPTSAWEKTAGVPLNTYQNGAYWHVPTGWLARALAQRDPNRAKRVVNAMIAHFRAEDWRTHDRQGAPWECLGAKGYRQNPVYMASITMPLQSLRAKASI